MFSRLRFDEEWYLKRYSDVRRAYERGEVKSAASHYLLFGAREGRLPHPPDVSDRRVFVYGSYGSNNVGDEAILDGVRKLYPKCFQFHQNRMRNGEGFFPHLAERGRSFFRSDDYLIIGGGGLLYNKETVTMMANIAESAVQAGSSVDICRLGCEAAHPSYYDEIRRLFSYAEKITVRSSNSQEIMQTITGEQYPVEFDFAFNLRPDIPKHIEKHSEITIGLATASLDREPFIQISKLVSDICKRRSGENINIVHFPQSRSYFNEDNNDVITGERIWVAASMQNSPKLSSFRTAPYVDEPIDVLKQYKKLDGLISSRYHGLVFANMCNIPMLAVGASQLKVGGFIKDHPSENVIGTDFVDILENFEDFLTIVKERRSRI